MAVTFAQVLLPGRAVTLIIRCELVVGRLTASSFPECIAHEHPTDTYFCTHAEGVQHLCCGCQAYGSAGQVNATHHQLSCTSGTGGACGTRSRHKALKPVTFL